MRKNHTEMARVAYLEEKKTFAALQNARAKGADIHTFRPLFDAWVIAYDALRNAHGPYEPTNQHITSVFEGLAAAPLRPRWVKKEERPDTEAYWLFEEWWGDVHDMY